MSTSILGPVSRILGFVALVLCQFGVIRDARASGGEVTMKRLRAVGRFATKMVRYPIPLRPGGHIRFNIAPLAPAGDTQTTTLVGVFPVAENGARAIGALSAFSDKGSAYASLVALGGKHALGGVLAIGVDGSAAGGAVALAGKDALSLGIAGGGRVAVAGAFALAKETAVSGYVGVGGRNGFGTLVGVGDKLGAGVVAGIGPESTLKGGYGIANAVRGLIRLLP